MNRDRGYKCDCSGSLMIGSLKDQDAVAVLFCGHCRSVYDIREVIAFAKAIQQGNPDGIVPPKGTRPSADLAVSV